MRGLKFIRITSRAGRFTLALRQGDGSSFGYSKEMTSNSQFVLFFESRIHMFLYLLLEKFVLKLKVLIDFDRHQISLSLHMST